MIFPLEYEDPFGDDRPQLHRFPSNLSNGGDTESSYPRRLENADDASILSGSSYSAPFYEKLREARRAGTLHKIIDVPASQEDMADNS